MAVLDKHVIIRQLIVLYSVWWTIENTTKKCKIHQIHVLYVMYVGKRGEREEVQEVK